MGDLFDTPGIRWTEQHGYDPDHWPLAPGQPMTWKEWARELSAEAVRQDFQPSPGFFPWDEAAMKWAARTCWVEDWFEGLSPKQVIEDELGGEDPETCPLPKGQALPWQAWLAGIEAEARKASLPPEHRIWSDMKRPRQSGLALCWREGDTPADIAEQF